MTLPINQFFNGDGYPNDGNIEQNKKNDFGFIHSENHKIFNIKSISVYPEGIPAIYILETEK